MLRRFLVILLVALPLPAGVLYRVGTFAFYPSGTEVARLDGGEAKIARIDSMTRQAAAAESLIYLVNKDDPTVYAFSLGTRLVTPTPARIGTPLLGGMFFHARNRLLYAVKNDGTLVAADPLSGYVQTVAQLAEPLSLLALDAARDRLYLRDERMLNSPLVVFDLATRTTTETSLVLSNYFSRIVLDPATGELFVKREYDAPIERFDPIAGTLTKVVDSDSYQLQPAAYDPDLHRLYLFRWSDWNLNFFRSVDVSTGEESPITYIGADTNTFLVLPGGRRRAT